MAYINGNRVSASVRLVVQGGDPKLQEKTATENGEVVADEGYDGLSKVTVNVENGSSMEGFHKVQFFNDDHTTLLYTVFIPTGASAIYAGETPASVEGSGIFQGFEPASTNVIADMDCYAVYESVRTLDETSWAVISALSASGEAQNYFSVGDTKMIHVEGTVGTLSVNADYGVYIIGFDHNEALEGKGITFGTFKTATVGGTDVALTNNINTSDNSGKKYFTMNHWGAYSYGGWAGCDMRYDILGSTDVPPSGYGAAKKTSVIGYAPTKTCVTNPVANTLMAALPADLRAVMKPMTIYTDNNGNSSNAEANVTASIDYLPPLSEFEIYGERTYANQYEQNKQAQYAYFASGNSKVKYNHSATGTAVNWWNRSAYFEAWEMFGRVFNSGIASRNSASISHGLAPIFRV